MMEGVQGRHGVDQISDLTDSLLHHVFSFLPFKDVIKTSVLSKRWRCLWKFTPSIDVCISPYKEMESFGAITKSFFDYAGVKIQKFHAGFPYKGGKDEPHEDSWICFASRRGVEVVDLDFAIDIQNFDIYFKDIRQCCCLSRGIFRCELLKVLKLRMCKFNFPGSLCLPRLTTLHLDRVITTDEDMKHLASSFPLLEDLGLTRCYRVECHLSLSIPNLRTLKLIDGPDMDYITSGVEICAPYLFSLHVGCYMRINSNIVKPFSIVNGRFEFDVLSWASDEEEYEEHAEHRFSNLEYEEHAEHRFSNFIRLLKALCHVKALSMCNWCTQVLSIREIRRLEPLSFAATCFEMRTSLKKQDLPGIIYALKSLPNLEHLTLNIFYYDVWDWQHDHLVEPSFDEREFWKSLDVFFSGHLHHLRMVKIYHFKCWDFDPEYEVELVKEFLKEGKNEIELVKFMFKVSVVLHEMCISTNVGTCISIDGDVEYWVPSIKPETIDNLTRELSALPKASADAKLILF